MGLRPLWSKLFFPFNPYRASVRGSSGDRQVFSDLGISAPSAVAPTPAPATPPTAPQQPLNEQDQSGPPVVASTMSDFVTAARVGQVWQSQDGSLLHLMPQFKFTGQDNNRVVFEGSKWRTQDNAQWMPTQPNTLHATDFPLTRRKDMQAVTASLKFADILSVPDVRFRNLDVSAATWKDGVGVDAEYWDEGRNGDFNSADPEDTPFIRITVNVQFPNLQVEQVDSVLTHVSTKVSREELQGLVNWIHARVVDDVLNERPITTDMELIKGLTDEDLADLSSTAAVRRADMISQPGVPDAPDAQEGVIDVAGHSISWWMRDAPDWYTLDTDDANFEHIEYMLRQGYVEGELIYEDPETDVYAKGWWSVEKDEVTAGVRFADMVNVPDPTGVYGAQAEANHIVVTLEDVGEGYNGEFNSDDPMDEPLLRLRVELWTVSDPELIGFVSPDEVDDDHKYLEELGSVCTSLSARITQEEAQMVVNEVLRLADYTIRNSVNTTGEIRQMLEEMSAWSLDLFKRGGPTAAVHTRTRTADIIYDEDVKRPVNPPTNREVWENGQEILSYPTDIDVQSDEQEDRGILHMLSMEPSYSNASTGHVMLLDGIKYEIITDIEGGVIWKPEDAAPELTGDEELPSHGLRLAAAPDHQGEYTWDQFRKAVRNGQIWRTNNSLIRIDRLMYRAGERWGARYIKFQGGWTGNGPNALRSLLPQRDGTFLSSTAPWSVSRRFAPFLLIKEHVREGEPSEDGAYKKAPPATPDARDGASMDFPAETPETNVRSQQGLVPPEALAGLTIVADAIHLPEAFPLEAAYNALFNWFRNHSHDSFLQPAFNVKVQRIDVPESVRDRLDEQEIADIVERYTTEFVQEFEDLARAEYPWISEMYFAGRSNGWLETMINFSMVPTISIVVDSFNNGQSWSARRFFDEWLAGTEMDEILDGEGRPDNDYSPQQIKAAQDAEQMKIVRDIEDFINQLDAFESDVWNALRRYTHTLEQEEFWNTEDATL